MEYGWTVEDILNLSFDAVKFLMRSIYKRKKLEASMIQKAQKDYAKKPYATKQTESNFSVSKNQNALEFALLSLGILRVEKKDDGSKPV